MVAVLAWTALWSASSDLGAQECPRLAIEGCPQNGLTSLGEVVLLRAVGIGEPPETTYEWEVEGTANWEIDPRDSSLVRVLCTDIGAEVQVTVRCTDEEVCCSNEGGLPAANASCHFMCAHIDRLATPCDWNGDGSIDVSDVVGLLSHIFLGLAPHHCGPLNSRGTIAVLDCNGDGLVDLSDAVCKLNFLFLGGPTPLPLRAAGDSGCLLALCSGDSWCD